ncbi:hypothetical protein D3C77_596630 [compost metagenome]
MTPNPAERSGNAPTGRLSDFCQCLVFENQVFFSFAERSDEVSDLAVAFYDITVEFYKLCIEIGYRFTRLCEL